MRRTRPSFSQASHPDEPTVNLTPLIDVVFVILIMFIVIAPLLEQDQVELAEASQISHQNSTGVQESSLITIHVNKDNTIRFNRQPTNLILLKDQLKTAKQQYPKATPQVFHDKQAHFGTYQSVKNAAEEAGFAKLDLILNPA